jgi:hypothetical protein
MVFSSCICLSTSASLYTFMVALRVPQGSYAPPTLSVGCLLNRAEIQTVLRILIHCDGGQHSQCSGTLEF